MNNPVADAPDKDGQLPDADTTRLAARRAVGESASVPNWEREACKGWMPGAKLVATLRDWRHSRNVFTRKLAVLRHRFWSAVSGADIPINSIVEGGLLIPHPCGIVIHPDVRIGPNCLIFQNATLGMRNGKVPQLGGHIIVGAGAVVLGDVRIGDHAVIGANAVVLQDVPAGATAVGNPAAVLR